MMRDEYTIWMLLTVVFITYFVISWVYYKLGITNLEKALLASNGLRFLNLKHGLGIVLFGVLFYLNFPGLRSLLINIEIPRLYILIPFILLVFILAYIAFRSSHVIAHKMDAISTYKFSYAWFYFFIRVLFLLCYEYFFRGVILFTLLNVFDPLMAIGISATAYLIIHLFDTRKEIIGTIPFGIILCVLAYLTQSVWYPFLLHIALSAVYEISIFYQLTIKTSKS
ncbi:CPBP family intramembrane glutamic endopeptidase [Aestuariivivens sediminis]|uniref:CPBP family intramembrane glutamic endopeptidase n=1 Tax=Aestuariivivens sediminis TaxID=2913557 RepID=UPI003B8A8640